VIGRTRARHLHRGDDGNAALEIAILAPVLLGLLALVIAAGRTAIAQSAVNAAARDASRQASLSLTPTAAQAAAQVSARAALRSDGLDCVPVVVTDTSQFGIPPGHPAAVAATVSCTVAMADLALPGLPGSVRLHAVFTSPLDTYRSRGTGLTAAQAAIRLNRVQRADGQVRCLNGSRSPCKELDT
jgi:Flp pilus assembly protein TadG